MSETRIDTQTQTPPLDTTSPAGLSRRWRVMLAMTAVVFVVGGLLGWAGVREIRKQRHELKVLREAVEQSLAPGEAVVVDDRFLGWALQRGSDGVLRQSLIVVSKDEPPASLLVQLQQRKQREMVLVATPDDRLVRSLDAAGFQVAQEVGWVPWDLAENGQGLLGRGRVRIFFVVAPKSAVPATALSSKP